MKPIALSICITCLLFLGCGESRDEASTAPQRSSAVLQQDSESSDSLDRPDEELIESVSVKYGEKFPEVTAVEVVPVEGEGFRFNVTLSSPYDSPARYADAWRVLDGQGNEIAVRILGHDHANEQPFTRSKTIDLPKQTSTVFVEGRDKANGWSGQRYKVELPQDAAP